MTVNLRSLEASGKVLTHSEVALDKLRSSWTSWLQIWVIPGFLSPFEVVLRLLEAPGKVLAHLEAVLNDVTLFPRSKTEILKTESTKVF